MKYDDLLVLIPCHSLEDFPTELGDEAAASLLNAFAVLWHPRLLASAGVIPSWRRADNPPDSVANRLVIVPTACDGWIPCDWIERTRAAGGVVVHGLSERQAMLSAALTPLVGESEPSQASPAGTQQNPTADLDSWGVDRELAADFVALGSCHLQMELLTRQMHHFSNLDEVYLQREAVAAAQAALAYDRDGAQAHLSACFESLQEARERFYPVECYLIDLCLLIPRLADDHLARLLKQQQPANLHVTAEDLEQIAAEHPQLLSLLREARAAGRIDVCGGEFHEGPVPLLPLASWLHGFHRGVATFQRLLGESPRTWSRYRFGLNAQLPQVLYKHGYHSGLHLVFDDGIYPDAEHSKLRWEGCDGTVIEAMTRIPLAADSATSYLRLPGRIAESMQQDQVAAVVVARWPEVKTPWFDDLRRIHKYAPVLGRFITFDNFFAHTDAPGRLSRYEQREYLSPFLYHSTALQEPDPISRYAEHALRRHRFDAARWYRNVASLLLGKQIDDDREATAVELELEAAGPEADTERQARASASLQTFEQDSAAQLAGVILQQAGREGGVLLLNPLSFPRRVSVEVPEFAAEPPIAGPVKAVQFDATHKLVTVDVPAAGYTWISSNPARPVESSNQPGTTTKGATVVENVLRNEFFEVFINEATGGIARIKEHGRKPNRLSQQLAYRFPRERKFVRADGEEDATEYSEMRCQSIEVTCAGPGLAEIVTQGEIVDQQFNTFLAEFRQTFRVWHGRPVLELDVELDIKRLPDSDPWKNYYASRFAWNDSAAALTRSVLQGAHGIDADRFESLDYLEIAEDEQRTTIVFFGLPFHRKTGMRMCDTLLVTPGETRRKFRFAVVVNSPYPLQAALDAMSPIAVVPTTAGPPSAGSSGWFFSVDAKNVQLIQVMALLDEPRSREVWEPLGAPPVPQGEGFAVRLLETEGRARQVKLQCWRTPISARKRDFLGRTISTAVVRDDAMLVEMGRYEIADVELRFGR